MGYELPGIKFAVLAAEADARGDLGEFGKCAAVFIAFLGLMLEQGVTADEVNAILQGTKTAAMSTASQLVAQSVPHIRE